MDAACVLWGMAHRYPTLRREVVAAFGGGPPEISGDGTNGPARRAILDAFERLERREGFEEAFLVCGAERIVARVKSFPEDSPYRRLQRIDDVPVDLARTAMLTSLGCTLEAGRDWSRVLMAAVPTIARASAADFFFPEDFTRAKKWGSGRFSHADVLALGRRFRRLRKSEVLRPPMAVRSAPCACGTGKKFKRCCGVRSLPDVQDLQKAG
jgi:hypothetical protein